MCSPKTFLTKITNNLYSTKEELIKQKSLKLNLKVIQTKKMTRLQMGKGPKVWQVNDTKISSTPFTVKAKLSLQKKMKMSKLLQ